MVTWRSCIASSSALWTLAGARFRAVDEGADQVGRQQIGRKLQPLERRLDRLGERRDRERFGKSGNALDENVLVAEQGQQQAVDELLLPDDDLADLAADLTEQNAFALDFFDDGFDVDRQQYSPDSLGYSVDR